MHVQRGYTSYLVDCSVCPSLDSSFDVPLIWNNFLSVKNLLELEVRVPYNRTFQFTSRVSGGYYARNTKNPFTV